MTELQKQFQEEKGVSFDEIPINGVHLEYITWLEAQVEALRIHDVVGRSEQLFCTCSRAKGLDHDEEGTPYCISCQKEVQ